MKLSNMDFGLHQISFGAVFGPICLHAPNSAYAQDKVNYGKRMFEKVKYYFECLIIR